MEAQELRIGNWVRRIAHWGWDENTVKLDDERTCSGFDISDYKQFDPIPLTEDWLIRMGFERDDETSFWEVHHKGMELYSIIHKTDFGGNYATPTVGIKDGEVYYYFEVEDFYYSWFKKLPYVHSIQNLHYALCGEELKIKEQ